LQPPDFWRREANPWPARLLSPLGTLYGAAATLRRWSNQPYHPGVPVIVAGGLTLGGSGKTPLALALAERLKSRRPHFLSRGYGGRLAGPLAVDPALHSAADVGDEPLLLAAAAPTWVSRDRPAGARAAVAAGAGLLVLDDGFQNPFIAKDLAFLAIDGEVGLANGHVFPAGPLREPAGSAFARASAVILIGEDKTGVGRRIAGRCPVLPARLVPGPDALALRGQRVLAFAGIGRPEKFFCTLAAIGAEVAERRAFADHHRYSPREARDLLAAAKARDLTLVTTEKDQARMARAPELAALQAASLVLPIVLEFDDAPALMRRVRGALRR
jgi:tetraacyldisaccharide 4'-kinase